MSDKPWRTRLRLRWGKLRDGWDRWGRDFWVFIVTVILLVVGFQTYATVDELAETRRQAVLDSCRYDFEQDDVLRAILNASLALQRDRPREPGRPSYRESVKLSERLMGPLGGLRQTEEEKAARCGERVVRGSPTP
jgi:hypothetical protein